MRTFFICILVSGYGPATLYLEIVECEALIAAVLDDDSRAAARDAVRDIAQDQADAAQSAARLNQRNTSHHFFKGE